MKSISPMYIILLILFTSLNAQARLNSRMKTKSVQSTCQSWALESKNEGISTLVIAFEGLWSLNQRKADRLQKYQTEVKKGKNPKLNVRGFGGYVTRGPLAHIVQQAPHEFAFAVLSHRTETTKNRSIGFTCVQEWYKVFGDDLKLNIIGHSFGGYASLFLMHKLNSVGIPIENMVTADARAYSSGYKYFYKSDNVKSFKNYYQKGFLRGYDIDGAENYHIRGESHGSIPSSEAVVMAVEEIL